MSKPYCYEYPRPSVTVDATVFGLSGDGLRALFIRRKKDPFAGHWAIPGGFLDIDEPIRDGALRELKEETGLDAPALIEEIGVFGTPGRDPRGRTISIAHAAVVRAPLPKAAGADDAAEAAWLDPRTTGPLAFDHPKILARALAWLSESVSTGPAGLALLPETFGAEEVAAMLHAAGRKRSEAARWVTARQKSRQIIEIAGTPGRFRAAIPAVQAE